MHSNALKHTDANLTLKMAPSSATITNLSKDLWTPKEVAQYLSMSIRQVWNLRALGELRGIKLSPRRTVFERQEVLNFVERKRDGDHREAQLPGRVG